MNLALLLRFWRWVPWLLKTFPVWRRRGRFTGKPVLAWNGPRNYRFIQNDDEPFAFERGVLPEEFRTKGEIIIPRDMDTDGGSIPKFAWSFISPWAFMPAYLIHDWEFEQHHQGKTHKSLLEVNQTLCEAVYTLMMDGVVPYSGLVLRAIYDGVSSPFGQDVWDGKRSVQ